MRCLEWRNDKPSRILTEKYEVLESCVPVTRLTLAIRNLNEVQDIIRIAKVNLVTGTQDSSTSYFSVSIRDGLSLRHSKQRISSKNGHFPAFCLK